ncbi:MAG: YbaB/EbfC family nucleoid-associated protein [Gammaproteobacteria bacterium]|nr:YbaB/EbfC family nucleoid-associated protein [Gammaproteobacteria bacterium]
MDNSLDGLMKQAKEMQEKMERLRSEAENSEVSGESGAGLVCVRMSGSHDVRSVKIDKSLLSEEKQVLEEMIAAAVNDAIRRVEEYHKSKLTEFTGGMPIPSGLKFPFFR